MFLECEWYYNNMLHEWRSSNFFYKNNFQWNDAKIKCHAGKSYPSGSKVYWNLNGWVHTQNYHYLQYRTTHYAFFHIHKCVCTTNFVCVRVFKENLRLSIKSTFKNYFPFFLKKYYAMAHPRRRHHHHIIKLVIIQK